MISCLGATTLLYLAAIAAVESWFAREAPGGNTIADLQLGADVIGIGSCSGLTGMGDFTQTGSDTLLSLLTDL